MYPFKIVLFNLLLINYLLYLFLTLVSYTSKIHMQFFYEMREHDDDSCVVKRLKIFGCDWGVVEVVNRKFVGMRTQDNLVYECGDILKWISIQFNSMNPIRLSFADSGLVNPSIQKIRTKII